VDITGADGTVISSVMTWKEVRRYLPGGGEFGTVARVELHRIVTSRTCHVPNDTKEG
jgi:hypothetical protein